MSAARANGCDVVDVAWWWSVVLALALVAAAVAARMLARTTTGGAQTGDRATPWNVAPGVSVVPLVVSSGASSCPTGDPALALLAWLAALGWVTFDGSRPRRWPWWDPQRARVWAATFASAPGVLR